MPTGYTADIAKGITFEQYAINCARAFGALILMRDEPSDAPISERFEPSDYHEKCLAAAQQRLTQLESMSDEEAATAAEAEHAGLIRSYESGIAEKDELRNKYSAMLAQVVAWEPPTSEHVNYKEFMIKQIRESIDWDCDTSDNAAPLLQSGQEWLAKNIASLRSGITYHSKENQKEIERTESRNAWVRALRDSLQVSA